MSKRWTYSDDVFLHAYFDSMGDYIGTHDLGRPKGAATARVKKLKTTGAWDALDRRAQAMSDYYYAVGTPAQRAEMDANEEWWRRISTAMPDVAHEMEQAEP